MIHKEILDKFSMDVRIILHRVSKSMLIPEIELGTLNLNKTAFFFGNHLVM